MGEASRRAVCGWLLLMMAALGLGACAPRATPVATGAPEVSARAAAPEAAVAASARTSGSRARSQVGFRTQALFDQHYAKHGHEFGEITKAEYLRIAQALRDAPAGGNVLEFTRDDGVTTRFDRGSGTFIAFNGNRTIRTCFRPNDGERYFKRQALRNERGR